MIRRNLTKAGMLMIACAALLLTAQASWAQLIPGLAPPYNPLLANPRLLANPYNPYGYNPYGYNPYGTRNPANLARPGVQPSSNYGPVQRQPCRAYPPAQPMAYAAYAPAPDESRERRRTRYCWMSVCRRRMQRFGCQEQRPRRKALPAPTSRPPSFPAIVTSTRCAPNGTRRGRRQRRPGSSRCARVTG